MSGVNLLPWRAQRRARCIRFWAVLLAGWLVLILAVTFGLRASQTLAVRALQLELTAIASVQQALDARRKQAPQTPLVMPQSPATPLWQPALVSLAQAFPPQAWLTALRYHGSTLTLTGYAATLPALTEMAGALSQVTGLTPGPAGELQQDEQGRWMFTFRLKSQG